MDAVFAEMIGAHIGDDRSVGLRYCYSTSKDAAARCFKNGRLRAPFAHHHPRARRSGIVSRRQNFIVDKYPVRAVVSRVPAMGPCASGQKTYRSGFPVGPCDDHRWDVPQFLPSDIVDIRQGGQRKTASADAGSEGQFRFVDDARQATCRRCVEKCPELRMRLNGRQALKAGERRGFLDDGLYIRRRIRGVLGGLQRLGNQRRLEAAPPNRIALDQRRAQRPLVHFGRQEQLIGGCCDRERCAARMPAHDGLAVGPSQPLGCAVNPRAPGGDQGIINGYVENLEHRPRGRKEQIAAHETPRILERQGARNVQSSLSGAMRMPRSSRMSPSRLNAGTASRVIGAPRSPCAPALAPLSLGAVDEEGESAGAAADREAELAAGAPLTLNLVICFQERTKASAKISSRSPGSPMRNAASMASCSSGIIEMAPSGTPAARRACV